MEKELKISLPTEQALPVIGNIYYRFDNDENIVRQRIVKMQNQETAICVGTGIDKTPQKIKMSTIKKDMTLLLSSAVLSISKVIVATTDYGEPVYDIVLMVFKRHDTEIDPQNPDIICRQAITDVFYEPFCTEPVNRMCGISITKDTCPAGYELTDFTTADDVIESIIVNVYKDDTLDTILSLIDRPKWNDTLLTIYQKHIKFLENEDPFFVEPADHIVDGYCTTVKDLLIDNNFMYDYYTLFGITPVTFVVPYDEDVEMNALPVDQKEAVQSIYCTYMDKTLVIPFDYDIELDEIRMPYVMIVDANHKVYIIAYTKSQNEYPKATLVSDEMKSVREKIAKVIAYNDKYSK